ncbi:MAG: hypothetical protein N2C14_11040 [Planctomycetales bacterium]
MADSSSPAKTDSSDADAKSDDAKSAGSQPIAGLELQDKLDAKREKFLRSLIGERTPDCVLRTDSRVDVGYWLAKGRLWACLLDDELVLFALGRRPLVQRAAKSDLNESHYNHVTGEIILAPIESLPVTTFRVAPLQGLELLRRIVGDQHGSA